MFRVCFCFYRFDCNPDPNGTEYDCLARNCCWAPPPKNVEHGGLDIPLNIPYCFYPVGHRSHVLINITKTERGASAFYRLQTASGYPKDVEVVKMDITGLDQGTLRVKVIVIIISTS